MPATGDTRAVLLWGPPASGKSTVGPCLARRLSRDFIDLDALLEARLGSPISSFIKHHGEGRFRTIERAAVSELSRTASVVSLGGGSLVHTATRRDALKSSWVVSLECDRQTLLNRLGEAEHRPLLHGDVSVSLDGLLSLRAGAYAEAHFRVNASRPVEDLCRDIEENLSRELPLVMPLGARTHRVVFTGLDSADRWIARECPSSRGSPLLLVSDVRAARWWRTKLSVSLSVPELRLEHGERQKTLSTAQRVWNLALDNGLTRESLLLALGGGVTTDLVGFSAALMHRGVRWVAMPTTLLSAVDASVGGKTAVDLRQGKNLVGVFHHPSLTLIDLSTLSTLPRRELRSGLAEVIKVALSLDPVLFDTLEANAELLRHWVSGDRPTSHRGAREVQPELGLLEGIVRRAVQAKIDVVAGDERDEGLRAVLNFGHTIGHAIEHASRYRLRHGECVAVGMAAALGLGVELGITPPELRDRTCSLITAVGLGLRARVDPVLAAAALRHDKKRASDAIKMVLIEGPGQALIVTVGLDRVIAALHTVLETRVS